MTPTGPEAASVEGVAPSLPTLVLGPKGELLRMEGIDPLVQHMVQEAERQGLTQQQMEQLPRLVRDGLERSARWQWEGLVGKWSGLALKPGESIERKSQTRVPRFGSSARVMKLRVDSTLELRTRSPPGCARCVGGSGGVEAP